MRGMRFLRGRRGRGEDIKTNLIDITTNKLVALYFACSSNPGKTGYVYCFIGNFFNINNSLQVLHHDEMYNDLNDLINNNDFRDKFMNDLIRFEMSYEKHPKPMR
jgi:hypothetical protein